MAQSSFSIQAVSTPGETYSQRDSLSFSLNRSTSKQFGKSSNASIRYRYYDYPYDHWGYGQSEGSTVTNPNWPENTMVHVYFVFDKDGLPDGNHAKLYINGQLVVTQQFSVEVKPYEYLQLSMYAMGQGRSGNFGELIVDNLKIWGKSIDDVNAEYKNGDGVPIDLEP